MAEMSVIRALLPLYPYVTVHAEHAAAGGDDGGDEDGRVVLPRCVRLENLPPASRYALAKIDVDGYPLLQLGITLCDAHGRLPALRTPWGGATAESVWQIAVFPGRDTSSGGGPATTTLTALAYALFTSRVVSHDTWGKVTWVAHGGLYHLGFLLKVLTSGAPMPDTKEEFLAKLRSYLGGKVFDVRYVAARLPATVSLKGPLAYLAALLGAPAAAAREPWQAGEKSLAACQVFMRIKGLFFAWDGLDMHAGRIHGLHTPPPPPSS
jgi:CCR4-NOT transcription complex subunit 7/8